VILELAGDLGAAARQSRDTSANQVPAVIWLRNGRSGEFGGSGALVFASQDAATWVRPRENALGVMPSYRSRGGASGRKGASVGLRQHPRRPRHGAASPGGSLPWHPMPATLNCGLAPSSDAMERD
jgi:hypothetical protein